MITTTTNSVNAGRIRYESEARKLADKIESTQPVCAEVIRITDPSHFLGGYWTILLSENDAFRRFIGYLTVEYLMEAFGLNR